MHRFAIIALHRYTAKSRKAYTLGSKSCQAPMSIHWPEA